MARAALPSIKKVLAFTPAIILIKQQAKAKVLKKDCGLDKLTISEKFIF